MSGGRGQGAVVRGERKLLECAHEIDFIISRDLNGFYQEKTCPLTTAPCTLYIQMKANGEDKLSFIKDMSFNSKMIDDPYILEAYIPREYSLHICEEDRSLADRNELIHPVGLVAARSLKYFSANGEGFNIFRGRGMAVWWLRHIYNSFNWWSAYVVNAEGERKDWPMLYIGENFGSAKGHKVKDADIVLSAFENDRAMVEPGLNGGTIFAAGYSDREGLFNSPDMYGVKIIAADKYKGAGVSVTRDIKENLRLMARHICCKMAREISLQNIYNEIKKMKIVILSRPRHKRLVETIEALGAEAILVRDDDLSPTFAVVRNEVDLIIGVGGVPEAVLSALIVKGLGGEMSFRLLPREVAEDERLLLKKKNWDSFRKNEIDILKNFQIVRPGTEQDGEIPWNKILTAADLARGNDMVFTASIIKYNPWIKYPDAKGALGVKIEPETGDITAHVVRIVNNRLEIIPVIYKTAISRYKEAYNQETDGIKRSNILIQLIKAYIEFGLFQQAKDRLEEAKDCYGFNKDYLQRCKAICEYMIGLDLLTNRTGFEPEVVIEHFERAYSLDRGDKEGLRPERMIKRYYEYLGDTNCHARRYDMAINYYRKAIQYSPNELKIYLKLNSTEMTDMLEEYFSRADRLYQEFNFREPGDWNSCKLKIALEVFYNGMRHLNPSSRDPWLIFFRKTVLHSEKPSYQMAILLKLLRLHNRLNYAKDDELIIFLDRGFKIGALEIDIIINFRRERGRFSSVGELYLIKGLGLECLTRLLFPQVKVLIHNELEDSNIPLSITIVDAMERRTKNIVEELREGYKEDAQEHQYSLAESYHYVGLTFYDIGNMEGAKIYYQKAIGHLNAIIKKFEGLTPVNAQYRIGDLYYELSLLFPEEEANYCKKAIEAYMCIIDEDKFIDRFGNILDLASTIREEALNMVECIYIAS